MPHAGTSPASSSSICQFAKWPIPWTPDAPSLEATVPSGHFGRPSPHATDRRGRSRSHAPTPFVHGTTCQVANSVDPRRTGTTKPESCQMANSPDGPRAFPLPRSLRRRLRHRPNVPSGQFRRIAALVASSVELRSPAGESVQRRISQMANSPLRRTVQVRRCRTTALGDPVVLKRRPSSRPSG
jgi:hypothetical protein